MTGKELIKKYDLENEIVLSGITVETFDMGFQYDFITVDGAGTSFGNMGCWPASVINSVNSIDNFLCDFGFEEGTEEYSKEYESIRKIVDKWGKAYCLYDNLVQSYDPEYYQSIEELKKAYVNNYCEEIVPWEDMSPDDIDLWDQSIDNEIDGFPINEY